MTAIDQKILEALIILKAIGVPLERWTANRQKRLALTLLTAAKLQPDTPWAQAAVLGRAGTWAPTTRGYLEFWNQHYGENYSLGSYDDVKRKDLAILEPAGLVATRNPNAATNDGTRGYGIAADASDVLRAFGTEKWQPAVMRFVETHGLLVDKLDRNRGLPTIPVKLPDGHDLELLAGEHNNLQRAIIVEFLPRFVPGADVLYVGDASEKLLYVNKAKLDEIKFFPLEHERLPDIVAYDSKRNWVFLIEAVHSINPITPLRHLMYEHMAKDCPIPIVYVSVFKDRSSFARFAKDISWETEVWLADSPEHMIHFNGGKFLGPYATRP
jgi:type II restriction enzyme